MNSLARFYILIFFHYTLAPTQQMFSATWQVFSEHSCILQSTPERNLVLQKLKFITEDITLNLLNWNTTKSSTLNNFHCDWIKIGLSLKMTKVSNTALWIADLHGLYTWACMCFVRTLNWMKMDNLLSIPNGFLPMQLSTRKIIFWCFHERFVRLTKFI